MPAPELFLVRYVHSEELVRKSNAKRLLLSIVTLRFLAFLLTFWRRGQILPLEILEESSMPRQQDLLQGTLDMLILRILSVEPMHGWGITQRVEQMSDEVLQVQQGSLYPAMERLGRKGWVTSEWRTTENNRKARYYSLTRAGRKQLGSVARNWSRLSAAVNRVMQKA